MTQLETELKTLALAGIMLSEAGKPLTDAALVALCTEAVRPAVARTFLEHFATLDLAALKTAVIAGGLDSSSGAAPSVQEAAAETKDEKKEESATEEEGSDLDFDLF